MPLTKILQKACKTYWLPRVNIVVDELIIQFKRRANETLIIPNKPIKTGFKLWIITNLGYILHWFYHTKIKGAWSYPKIARLNPTASVVIHLLEALPKGPKEEPCYHVWLDNLFTSQKLLLELRNRGFGVTGTARFNSGIAEDLLQLKREDKADIIPWGTLYICYTSEGFIAHFLLKDNS